MRQITQTKMYRPPDHPDGLQHGNCQRAAMAAILDLDIDGLPPFEDAMSAGAFWRGIYDWLADRGLAYEWHPADKPPPGYSIASGPAPRGVDHAVVALDGVIVWDPHPSRAGLIEIENFMTFPPMTEVELSLRDLNRRPAAAEKIAAPEVP